MTKHFIIATVISLTLPLTAMAQKHFPAKQLHLAGSYLQTHQVTKDSLPFRHLDIAVTGSTSGLGFDIAVPLCRWAQIRAGAVFRPYKTYSANFSMQMGEEVGIKISDERFKEITSLMKTFTNTTPDRSILMQGDLKMNNYKFLVDIYPIQKHRNFHVTVGFYYGNDILIEANTAPSYLKTQAAINTFNTIYKRALAKESLMDIEGIATEAGTTIQGDVAFASAIERLRRWGSIKDADGNPITYSTQYIDVTPDTYVDNRTFSANGISIGLGKFDNDIIAPEDIYYDYSIKLDNPYYVKDDTQASGYREETYQRDANGTEIKKGNIRYHKGDVIYHAGDDVRLTPDEANQLTTTGRSNKFKPYVGVGYTVPLTKDKRTCLSVDVAALFWGGHPSVNTKVPLGVNASGNTVYQAIDITREVHSLPTSVQNYVNTLKRYPVFPEIGIRLSHRLW